MTARKNIEIYQGATWRWHLSWTDDTENPIDISGWKARMQVRQEAASPDLLLELTDDNGGIVIDGPAGALSLEASAAQTAAMTPEREWCVYDLEIDDTAGYVKRLVMGKAFVSREVTR